MCGGEDVDFTLLDMREVFGCDEEEGKVDKEDFDVERDRPGAAMLFTVVAVFEFEHSEEYEGASGSDGR